MSGSRYCLSRPFESIRQEGFVLSPWVTSRGNNRSSFEPEGANWWLLLPRPCQDLPELQRPALVENLHSPVYPLFYDDLLRPDRIEHLIEFPVMSYGEVVSQRPWGPDTEDFVEVEPLGDPLMEISSLLWRYGKALILLHEKLPKESVGLLDCSDVHQPHLLHQPVL